MAVIALLGEGEKIKAPAKAACRHGIPRFLKDRAKRHRGGTHT